MNRQVLVAVLLISSLLAMYGSSRVNNHYGSIQVSNVAISGENTITGVLYKPNIPAMDAPCVLLAHGVTNSKEPLSGIALELAKHGYYALSIDLVGHGGSTGSLDGVDPSLGVIQAAEYLLEYSNRSHIGLVGHSLGAGAVYYAASHGVSENGIVFIGGGLGSNYYDEESMGFMPSQPWNPLVIIGRYDVLFNEANIDELLQETLPVNTPQLDVVQGENTAVAMTLLLMPPTSHLFEPIDPTVVSATVDWFNTINDIETTEPQTYLTREALILIAFILFIAALVTSITLDTTKAPITSFDWRKGALYGLTGFILFLPSMIVGSIIPFPPQIFGSSIAWWLLLWGIIMLILRRYMSKTSAKPSIGSRDILYALACFAACYLFIAGLEYFYGFGYRLLVPIMRKLTYRRLQSLLMYTPFMLIHFYAESSLLKEGLGNLKGFLVSKVGLFALVILVQYGGFFLLDTVFVSGLTGFVLEFLLAIVPMLLISGLITHYGYRANRTGLTIILNTLIFSWIAAGLFPY